MCGVVAGAGARGGRAGLVGGPGTSVEGWAGSGMHGVHRTGLGDVEPGRGACQKGGACPGGAGKVMGRGLGAGRVVGMCNVSEGLGARVGWVDGVWDVFGVWGVVCVRARQGVVANRGPRQWHDRRDVGRSRGKWGMRRTCEVCPGGACSTARRSSLWGLGYVVRPWVIVCVGACRCRRQGCMHGVRGVRAAWGTCGMGCVRHGVRVGSSAGFKKGLGLHCGRSCTCQTELKVVRRLGDFVMSLQRMRGRIWSA